MTRSYSSKKLLPKLNNPNVAIMNDATRNVHNAKGVIPDCALYVSQNHLFPKYNSTTPTTKRFVLLKGILLETDFAATAFAIKSPLLYRGRTYL